MPNWRRIKKLREHLATVRPKQINMAEVLVLDRDKETIRQALSPECVTVGCIAGYAFCLFSPKTQVILAGNSSTWETWHAARRHLELDEAQARHVFYAHWHLSKSYASGDITKREILRYLDKAIKEKNVMVTL